MRIRLYFDEDSSAWLRTCFDRLRTRLSLFHASHITRTGGQSRRKLDVSRARERFGFAAKTSFEEGLRRAIEWYLR